MDPTSFLAPAVKCVEALQITPVAQTRLFEDPRNVALASAISMLSHTAQYVDNMVRANDNLYDMGIFVACRAEKNVRSGTTMNPTFLLWNSVSEPKESSARVNDRAFSGMGQENPAGQNSHFPHLQHLDQGSLRHSHASQPSRSKQNPQTLQILDGIAETQIELPQPQRQQPQSQQPQSQQPQSQQPQSGQRQASPMEDLYTVPIGVAAKCLELLLDGSGFTAHRHIFQKRSFTELSTKPLVDALKEVFKAEQDERISRRTPSVSKPTGNKEEMIYCDLLPDTLRSRTAARNIMVRVPEVVLEETGSVTVPKYMKVSMNIRKPDRNKKDQNFAVLCALLDHTGPTGICAKTLGEFASQGFTPEGCKRRKRYSTSLKSTSIRSQETCRDNRALCSFSISPDADEVGKGTVDPYATEHNGRKIKDSNRLVRFVTVKEYGNICFSSDLTVEQKKSMHSAWLSRVPAVWPKSCIQRIELLGDYDKPIGTGIFVQKLF